MSTSWTPRRGTTSCLGLRDQRSGSCKLRIRRPSTTPVCPERTPDEMPPARFVRADLHVHAGLGPGEIAPASVPTVAGMVAAARSANVSILGITDHNSIDNVDAALALAGPDLLVLPGIEISGADSDLIALFAPDALANLRDLVRPDVLQLRDAGGGAMRSTRSTADLVGAIGERGGIAILAHIDVSDGFVQRANHAAQSDVFSQPHLAG